MKKFGILLFVAALAIGLVAANIFSFGKFGGKLVNFSINFNRVHGSGVAASDVRNVSEFKSVDVGGVFKVEITAQKEYSVQVEADDNILPLIKTEVRNGTLYIDTDGRVSPKSGMVVRISAPDIDDLDVSGVAQVSLAGIDNQSLTVDGSGATKVTVSGVTAKLLVGLSGASKLYASELVAENCNIDASGASYADVNVTGVLRSDLSGASHVEYGGSPTDVQTDKSGGSRVTKK